MTIATRTCRLEPPSSTRSPLDRESGVAMEKRTGDHVIRVFQLH